MIVLKGEGVQDFSSKPSWDGGGKSGEQRWGRVVEEDWGHRLILVGGNMTFRYLLINGYTSLSISNENESVERAYAEPRGQGCWWEEWVSQGVGDDGTFIEGGLMPQSEPGTGLTNLI